MWVMGNHKLLKHNITKNVSKHHHNMGNCHESDFIESSDKMKI